MAQLDTTEYYLRRSDHARTLARNSVTSEIATLYLRMAQSYEELAAASSADMNAAQSPVQQREREPRRDWTRGAQRLTQ